MGTDDLRTHALTVLTAANPTTPIPTGHSPLRVQVAMQVRADTGCGLREAVEAVDWAIGRTNATGNIDRHRVPATAGWRYEFANGQIVTVINDHRRPFRFEVVSDDPADASAGGVACGLTTGEVEAKLHAIAAL